MPKYSLSDYDMSGREDYVTCPRCGGSGMDNDSLDHKCFHCHGTKRVPVSKERDSTPPDDGRFDEPKNDDWRYL